jgi:micrococcal nuclease
MWAYEAGLEKVVNSDTVDLVIDLGFYHQIRQRFRLARLDAYKTEAEAKDKNEKAIAYMEGQLRAAKSIRVVSYKDRKDKFARYLADIVYDGRNLNKELLDQRFVKPYRKGGK